MIPELYKYIRHEGYKLSTFQADLIAGITVAIVALPLSMALAIASGASPEKGLVTAVVAGFFISCGSHLVYVSSLFLHLYASQNT